MYTGIEMETKDYVTNDEIKYPLMKKFGNASFKPYLKLYQTQLKKPFRCQLNFNHSHTDATTVEPVCKDHYREN